MKYYIKIKYSKFRFGRIAETKIINSSNSKKAIIAAIKKANEFDPYCEISEMILRTKP